MRQKRSKTYRKLLSSYILHFNFRPPFQLLIDAPFTHSLAALHLTPQEVDHRLSDVLQTSQLSKGKTRAGNPEMKCLITQCCMVQLYQAEKEGKIEKDAVNIAKSWERRRCNHREAIDADECLKEVIGPNNKHRYLVASDSKKLRNHLREEVAGLPLVHTNQSRVIVLEPMSDKTKARVQELEHAKLGGQPDSQTAPALGSNVVTEASLVGQTGESSKAAREAGYKMRKTREANPLSNKKPKKVLEAEKAEKERRTREIAERTEAKRRKAAEEERERQRAEDHAAREGNESRDDGEEREDDTASKRPAQQQQQQQQQQQRPVGEGNDVEDGQAKKKRKRGGRGAGGKAVKADASAAVAAAS